MPLAESPRARVPLSRYGNRPADVVAAMERFFGSKELPRSLFAPVFLRKFSVVQLEALRFTIYQRCGDYRRAELALDGAARDVDVFFNHGVQRVSVAVDDRSRIRELRLDAGGHRSLAGTAEFRWRRLLRGMAVVIPTFIIPFTLGLGLVTASQRWMCGTLLLVTLCLLPWLWRDASWSFVGYRTRRFVVGTTAGCAAIALIRIAGLPVGRPIPAIIVGGAVLAAIIGRVVRALRSGSTVCWPIASPVPDLDLIVADRRGTTLDMVALHRGKARVFGFARGDPRGYVIHGTTVRSPCDGVIIRAVDQYPDVSVWTNPWTVSRSPNGTATGNHVIISAVSPDGRPFSLQLGHLLLGTLRVAVGDHVTVGQPLGRVGHSGHARSPCLQLRVAGDTGGDVPGASTVRAPGRPLRRNEVLAATVPSIMPVAQ
jgi:hypothetical protein